MAGDPPRLPWSDAIGYLSERPLDGYVMEPEGKSIIPQAASIICGHDFIQALDEEKQAEFQLFIREVLTSLTTNRIHR